MASLNKVILIGNLTRDPEVRFTPKGNAVCDMGIAVNRRYLNEATGERVDEVTYLDIVVWNKQAELAGQYLAKGRSVYIEGRLQMDSWEDKATGQKRSKIKVVAEQVQFLSSPNREGGHQSSQQPPRQQPARRTAADAMDDAMRGQQQAGPDGDDIPF